MAVELVRVLTAVLWCETARPVLVSSSDTSFAELLPCTEAKDMIPARQPAVDAVGQVMAKTLAGSERHRSDLAGKHSTAGPKADTS